MKIPIEHDAVLAVVGDTHVPDRVDGLHPHLLGMLEDLKPDRILHTGDISESRVLVTLARIAPVLAVRGNRDWKWKPTLPMEIPLEIHGRRLLLLHGHGSWGHYFADKADHILRSYRLARYEKYFTRKYPGVDMYIFGHSHFPENSTVGGKLFFNPGSACLGGKEEIQPSFGVLKVTEAGRIECAVIPLEGYKIDRNRWVTL
jgi:hypothetical protein